MSDDQREQHSGRWRRFRIGRRVKDEPVRSRGENQPEVLDPQVFDPEVLEPEVLEPEVLEPADDADPGTAEMDRSLRKGCTGCLNVTFLIFVIMIASILGTCFIRPR